MFKSEAASWFRIYEMFQFNAFHMYGIIGSALFFGIIITYTLKRFNVRSFLMVQKFTFPKKNADGNVICLAGLSLAWDGLFQGLSWTNVYCFGAGFFLYSW